MRSAPAASVQPDQRTRPVILLVDDNPEDRAAARYYLESDPTGGFVVRECAGALEGLREAMEEPPDCLVLDFHLPEMNAIRFLDALASSNGTLPFAVVVLTGGGDELAEECLRHGAQDFLVKSLDMTAHLGRAVRGAMQRYRLTVERDQAEDRLRQSEALQRSIFENAAVGMARVALDGHWLQVNQKLCDIVGYSAAELLGGLTFADMTHPDDLQTDLENAEALIAGRIGTYSMEKRYFRKDRSIVWVKLTVAVLRRSNGAPECFISVVEDITAAKQSEAVVRESERGFRTMADNSPGIIWLTEADGSCSYLSRRWYEFTGQPPEESLGFGWVNALHDADRDFVVSAFRKVASEHEPLRVEFRLRRKDGQHCWAILTAAPRFTHEGLYLGCVASVIDISDRKAFEEALRASEIRFRTMAELVPSMIFVTDEAGSNTYTNERFQQYTGLAPEQLLGVRWVWALHPEDEQRALSSWQEAVRTEAPYEAEYRIRRADAQYRWFLVRGVPVRDENRRVAQWFGTCTDIDDYKNAEFWLRRANEDLQQFAWAASHDLQEPLRMVVSFSQLLQRQYESRLDSQARQYIAYAVEGAKRIETLLAGLRDYWNASERTADNRHIVELDRALQDAIGDLRTAVAESGAQITSDPLPQVMAEHVPMVQLFQNLIGNAIKYRDSRRPPWIHVSALNRPQDWLISVEDNGIGIKPEYWEQVFGIFKRLHGRDDYSGAGIGLALCRTIVQRAGGRIWVESEPGVGSRFRFTLPKQRE